MPAKPETDFNKIESIRTHTNPSLIKEFHQYIDYTKLVLDIIEQNLLYNTSSSFITKQVMINNSKRRYNAYHACM